MWRAPARRIVGARHARKTRRAGGGRRDQLTWPRVKARRDGDNSGTVAREGAREMVRGTKKRERRVSKGHARSNGPAICARHQGGWNGNRLDEIKPPTKSFINTGTRAVVPADRRARGGFATTPTPTCSKLTGIAESSGESVRGAGSYIALEFAADSSPPSAAR